jgi:hypothetical protein
MNYDCYLRILLKYLDQLPNNLTQITIVKPFVDIGHVGMSNYYNFMELKLSNIQDKIKIVEQENFGASYSQFFNVIYKNDQFDYHIVIEDDYIPFVPHFDKILVEEYKKRHNDNLFLCNGFLKVSDGHYRGQDFLDLKNIKVADFSLGILSRNSIQSIKKDITLEQILNHMKSHSMGEPLCYHQLYQSYIFNRAKIEIDDICNDYISIFYENGDNIFMLLNTCNPMKTSEWVYMDHTYNMPLFLPTQVLFNNNTKLLYRSIEFIHRSIQCEYIKLLQIFIDSAKFVKK